MTELHAPTLLATLVAGDERTQEEIVEGFLRCARDNQEDATLSVRTLHRWMAGDVQTTPRPAQRRVARKYWGYPMGTLLSPTPVDYQAAAATRFPPAAPRVPDVQLAAPGNDADAGPNPTSLERQVTMSTRRAARFTAFAETHNVGPKHSTNSATMWVYSLTTTSANHSCPSWATLSRPRRSSSDCWRASKSPPKPATCTCSPGWYPGYWPRPARTLAVPTTP